MKQIRPDYVRALLELLDHCAAGALDAPKLAEVEDAVRALGYSGNANLDHALHRLYHFIADADVRARDSEYGAKQRHELRNAADQIRREWLRRDDPIN